MIPASTSSSTTDRGNRPATIYEVAQKAGVSISTVSRVLNGGNKENWKSTAKRAAQIRRIAKEMGYRPSWRARAFAKQRTQTIGLVHRSLVPAFTGDFWADVISTLGEVFHDRDYDVQFVPGAQQTVRMRKMLTDRRFDGCIVSHELLDDVKGALIEADMPVALLNAEGDGRWPSVVPDDYQGARLLVEHLLELGHRRIAFVDHDPIIARHFSFRLRVAGFRETMHKAGVGDGAKVYSMPIEQFVDSIQQADERPTAVIAYNDQSMPPLMHACWRRGLRVPNDLSAVTFNDSASARYSIPPLTTIHVPGEAMGRRAAELLLEQIDTNGQAMPVSVVLPERLIVRESSAPPPENRS